MQNLKSWDSFEQANPRLKLKNFFERRGLKNPEQVTAYLSSKGIQAPPKEKTAFLISSLPQEIENADDDILDPDVPASEVVSEEKKDDDSDRDEERLKKEKPGNRDDEEDEEDAVAAPVRGNKNKKN